MNLGLTNYILRLYFLVINLNLYFETFISRARRPSQRTFGILLYHVCTMYKNTVVAICKPLCSCPLYSEIHTLKLISGINSLQSLAIFLYSLVKELRKNAIPRKDYKYY